MLLSFSPFLVFILEEGNWSRHISVHAARPGPHLLIQNVDVQSLQAASKPPAAHIEKMVLQYGLFAALVVFPGLAAAAVSYTSSSAGEQVATAAAQIS